MFSRINKILSNKKGFTLVEVIVVAVIVAALAAVAVGAYLNYVSSARDNAAANAGGSIASFCSACINSSGTLAGTGVGGAADGPGTITCALTGTSINVPEAMNIAVSAAAGSGTVTIYHTARGAANAKTFNY